MNLSPVTTSATRPVFAVPPVRPAAAVARRPEAVEEAGREAPKDRVELSADARAAAGGLPASSVAAPAVGYKAGSVASRLV